ncbi:hypothetical protein SEA_FAITH5X5_53 [Gordonia phage Faith5x5]|nr:hypothetical protein SEA_FAITH5X5_53 [Gordonia phage Faith5x5]
MFYEGRIARALNNQVKDGALNGAREALAPLRNLHRPTYRYLHATGACIHDEHDTFEVANGDHVCRNCTDDDGGPQKVCAECLDEEGSNIDWPCATARLIYPEDDL